MEKYNSSNYETLKRTRVSKACTNCRKAHACCNALRPCSRCIKFGLESSCRDAKSKKRGPKRKRDDMWLTQVNLMENKNQSNSDPNSFNNGRVMVTTFFPSQMGQSNGDNGNGNDNNQVKDSKTKFTFSHFSVPNKQNTSNSIHPRNVPSLKPCYQPQFHASNSDSSCITLNSPNSSSSNLISRYHNSNNNNCFNFKINNYNKNDNLHHQNDLNSNNNNQNQFFELNSDYSSPNNSNVEKNSIDDECNSFNSTLERAHEEHIDITQSGRVQLKIPSQLLFNDNDDEYYQKEEFQQDSCHHLCPTSSLNQFQMACHNSINNNQTLNFDVSIEDAAPSLSARHNYFNVKVGKIIFATEYSLRFTSSEIMNMWGYSRQEFKRMSFLDLCHPDYIPLSQKKSKELRRASMTLPEERGGTKSFILGRGLGLGKNKSIFEFWHKTIVQRCDDGRLLAQSYFYFY